MCGHPADPDNVGHYSW